MTSPDTCGTLVPYFKVADGQLPAFKAIVEQFVAKSRTEPGCVHYAFSFAGQEAHCREGYDDAPALLAHWAMWASCCNRRSGSPRSRAWKCTPRSRKSPSCASRWRA